MFDWDDEWDNDDGFEAQPQTTQPSYYQKPEPVATQPIVSQPAPQETTKPMTKPTQGDAGNYGAQQDWFQQDTWGDSFNAPAQDSNFQRQAEFQEPKETQFQAKEYEETHADTNKGDHKDEEEALPKKKEVKKETEAPKKPPQTQEYRTKPPRGGNAVRNQSAQKNDWTKHARNQTTKTQNRQKKPIKNGAAEVVQTMAPVQQMPAPTAMKKAPITAPKKAPMKVAQDPLMDLGARVRHMEVGRKQESEILCTLNSTGATKNGKLVFEPGFARCSSIIPIIKGDNEMKEGFRINDDETEVTLTHGGHYYITFTTVAQKAELLIGNQCFASVRGRGDSSLTLNIFVTVRDGTSIAVGVKDAIKSNPTDHWISIRYISC